MTSTDIPVTEIHWNLHDQKPHGSGATLECQLENHNNSQLEFQWFKGSTKLPIQSDILNLEDLNLEPKDCGQKIICQVNIKDDPNASNFSSKVDLNLQFEPQTQNYHINYNMVDDQNTLTIEIWANPKPSEAIWTVNNQDYTIPSSSMTKIREGKWSIALPSGVQSSEYSLKVANTYGKAEYIFKNSYSAKSILPAPKKLVKLAINIFVSLFGR